METAEQKENKILVGSYLRDEIVTVKAIESSGKWSSLLVKGQEMKKDPFMYNKVKRSFQVPLRHLREGGGVTPILDDQRRILIQKYKDKFPNGMTQREFFEQELGEDLNPTKKIEENFWRVGKNSRVSMDKSGLTLNLNLTMDMLRYLILKSNAEKIAPNYEERKNKASYEFMIVDEGKIVSKKVEEGKIKAKASAKFMEVIASKDKMIGFIKSIGRAIPASVIRESSEKATDWLEGEILTVLENDPVNFLSILEHPHYNARIFVQNAVECGAIIRMGEKRYTLDNGVELGDLTDVIAFFENIENQETKQRVKAKIEMANK